MNEEKTKRMAIIAIHGTLDLAYPPLILASTAVAMDMEAGIFFTFYGLEILKKKPNLQVSPIANPAAPPPISTVPVGVPNIVGMLPGMTAMATGMMKGWMKSANVATIPKLLEACQKGGVRMIGCLMTMNVMGIKKEDLIDGVELGGAGTFVDYAADASTTLAF
ncbi:MAG: DsrE/DsrF/DrsH-like family protein [Nitrospinota bacterium]